MKFYTIIFILLACAANTATASSSSKGRAMPFGVTNQDISNHVFSKPAVAAKAVNNTSACPAGILCPNCTLKEPGTTSPSTEDSAAEASFFDSVWQRLALALGVL